MLLGETDFPESERQEALEDVVVVAAQVDDFGFPLFRHLEDFSDHAAVAR
jgi:hypothetical protein